MWFKPLNPPITSWARQRVWLVGASTGIGRALAAHLHGLGAQVLVSARQPAALASFCAQHPGAQALALDVSDAPAVRAAAQQVLAQGPLDLVLYCAGYFRAQRASAFDLDDMLRHQSVNYQGVLHLLDALLPALQAQGHGHISLVSSVAGYRGLPNSLAYGPTKAALSNLAETLYLDLHPLGLGVSLVCPGFVDTPLTAQNEFRMPGLITPERAAQEMVAGWRRGLFEIHFPKGFTRWMKLLQLLPYRPYFAAVRRFTGL